jgi:hypothetical protein
VAYSAPPEKRGSKLYFNPCYDDLLDVLNKNSIDYYPIKKEGFFRVADGVYLPDATVVAVQYSYGLHSFHYNEVLREVLEKKFRSNDPNDFDLSFLSVIF